MFRIGASIAVIVVIGLAWFLFGGEPSGTNTPGVQGGTTSSPTPTPNPPSGGGGFDAIR